MERHKWRSEGNKQGSLNEKLWGEEVEFNGQAVSRTAFNSMQRFYPEGKKINDVRKYLLYLIAFVDWNLM